MNRRSPPSTTHAQPVVLYQARDCGSGLARAWYQSSGAYGFRDQLQAYGVGLHRVARARGQIVAPGRQFLEGGRQHVEYQSGRGCEPFPTISRLPYVVDNY